MKTRRTVEISDYGLDALIDRVADETAISREAAAKAVDIVLTAVKGKLPEPMAEKLIVVVAGEDDYSSAFDRVTRRVSQATDGARGSSVRFYRQTGDRMREVVDTVRTFLKPGDS